MAVNQYYVDYLEDLPSVPAGLDLLSFKRGGRCRR